VSRLKDGHFTNWGSADNLSSETINAIVEDRSGTIWAATPNGLDAFSKSRWISYGTSDGLPSVDVRTLFVDAEGTLWIATSDGIAYYANGLLHCPQRASEILREPIAGIAEDGKGSLWFVTTDHDVEVSRDKLLTDSITEFDVRSYSTSDGLPGVQGVTRYRSMVNDSQRRIWVSLDRGLAMTEGKVTREDATPALARVDSITADHTPIALTGIPAISHPVGNIAIAFGYAGLSNPDRIRYRYRLDGFDKNWSEASSMRQVTYTNLPPRKYRFEVIASNAAGLWNNPIATVDFELRPAFWQTWWFRLLIPISCLLLFFAFHRLRMYQLVRAMNQRFQERLGERTRIARELHDTLLQGVLSASMQLDVAVDQLPEESPAKSKLQHVLDLMGRVTEDGRNTLRGLRSASDPNLSLEQSFSRVKEELAMKDGTNFRVVSVSDPRPIRPVIRDEVYRIGREALSNAFHHAQARFVEVEIEYGTKFLRVLVRDDGRGIDSNVLTDGRDGHFGLTGMRERSEKIGARLRLRSRAHAGTEVELIVPGVIAFAEQNAESRGAGTARTR
jgi:signal transduction histidine kinase